MKKGYKRGKKERLLSGLMAAVCFGMAVLTSLEATVITSHAGTFYGQNIWRGNPEILMGSSRNYLYRWSDGRRMTFCLAPGKRMNSGITSVVKATHIDDDEIPYIGSREDYEKLALICSWFERNGSISADNAAYAAAQAAVWAIAGGSWEQAEELEQTVDHHVPGAYERWRSLKAYVENTDGPQAGFPDWLGMTAEEAKNKTKPMELKDGLWTAEFDISGAPQLAAMDWQFEGDAAGWFRKTEGGKLIFTCSGNQPEGRIVSAPLSSSLAAWGKNSVSLDIYVPIGDYGHLQPMIGAGAYEPKVYINLAAQGAAVGAEAAELKIYEHRETFRAHYRLELDKRCAETGQLLEGAVFRVLEAFESGQAAGKLRLSDMSPQPAKWKDFKICAHAVTDRDGHIFHEDIKEYDYHKTYCDGHPEPEYLDVPEYDSDANTGWDNAEEIEAVEAENELLRERWEALIAACEEETDFHSVEEGEGRRMMLEDRLETYRQFIGLRYDYTFEEIQARYGYIRHGGHRDDREIPVVRVSSSEAGGTHEVIQKEVRVNERAGNGMSRRDEKEGRERDETGGRGGSDPAVSRRGSAALKAGYGKDLPEDVLIRQTREPEPEDVTEGRTKEAKPENAPSDRPMEAGAGNVLPGQTKEAAAEDGRASQTKEAGAEDGRASQTKEAGAEDGRASQTKEAEVEDGRTPQTKEAVPEKGPKPDRNETATPPNAGKESRMPAAWNKIRRTLRLKRKGLDLDWAILTQSGMATPSDTEGNASSGTKESETSAGEQDRTSDGKEASPSGTEKATPSDAKGTLPPGPVSDDKTPLREKEFPQSDGKNLMKEKPDILYEYRFFDKLSLFDSLLRLADRAGRLGDDIAGGASLPLPEEDDEPWIRPSGSSDRTSFYCHVENHRTEGEFHINKRDLDLDREAPDYDSYGIAQGDAVLEGAVYGLYAAEDIIHPDGVTGVVYHAGELTAVAATDKNGDASFMAYTEESGVSPQAANRDNRWTGHPLICGKYDVREITRSEGYELTNRPEQSQPIGRADVTGVLTHPIDMHDGSWMEFPVTYDQTERGFDLWMSGLPEGALFYRSRMKESSENSRVITGSRLVETGEYERAEEGEYRLDENGDFIPLRDPEGNIICDPGQPLPRTCLVTRRLQYYPNGKARPTVDPRQWSDTEQTDGDYIKAEVNSMLKQIGYRILDPDTGSGAQWTVLKLSGTTNQQLGEEILKWFAEHSFWDSGAVHQIRQDGGGYQAVIFHDYTRLGGTAVYDRSTDTVYMKIRAAVAGRGDHHMFVPFSRSEFTMENGYATIACPKQVSSEIPFLSVMEDYLEPVCRPVYEQYKEGDLRLDGRGSPIPICRWEPVYETREETVSEYELTPVEAVYDAASGCYRVHAENKTDWEQARGPVTETFRVKVPDNTMVSDGKEILFSDYLTDVTGAGVSAFAAVWPEGTPAGLTYPGQISPFQDGPGNPGQGTRIRPFPVRERIICQPVKVIKEIAGDAPDQKLDNFRFKAYLKSNLTRLYRDGDGRIVWLDRRGSPIDILPSNASYPGLVPAVYTKVPRKEEPLYKNPANAVIAADRLHKKAGKTIGEGDEAASENGAKQGQEPEEYTAILETTEEIAADGSKTRSVRLLNYDKFFDAVAVANHEKWDDASPGYTSHRPMGKGENGSEAAEENAKASDMVRQFAIDWYLDDEAAAMEKEESVKYSDQLYDQALRQAITKAQDYLKPFFLYDLDEIYAVKWDNEKRGGTDRDKSTLSADRESEAACFGVSAALPYGVYVIVEQQPRYAALGDYRNRHYRTDRPKEIVVPSVYQEKEGGDGSGDGLDGRYIYDASFSPDELAERYRIRFHEESDVIRAHNHSGDFEIYKYGMNMDKISHGRKTDLASPPKGSYFALTQDRWKPFLNYYNHSDDQKADGPSYYLSEGLGGRGVVGGIYHYSSVSEDAGIADSVGFPGGEVTEENPDGIEYRDQVMTMTGSLTAYDGLYSAALVPVSPGREGTMAAEGNGIVYGSGSPVSTPAGSAAAEESSMRYESGKTADAAVLPERNVSPCVRLRFRNRLYTARLRIEKLDSDTHENLLHDGAIFNIYRASREEAENGEGRALFYEKDTMAAGSRAFLESMGAGNIRPVRRMMPADNLFFGRIRQKVSGAVSGRGETGELYTGIIPAGTPICREADRLFQTDGIGVRTGMFGSFTTTRDGQMPEENGKTDKNLIYAEQNAGYLETPQPLEAGVYVLAEAKAPAGYARCRPIAVEIYSDFVTYYQNSGKDSRVAAAVYDNSRKRPYAGQNQPAEHADMARLYVENEPTLLKAEKKDDSSVSAITYKVSGRVDGSLTEIGGNPNYEYAWKNGVYMGYAWKKGTLEYLKARQEAGEQVRIIYHGGLFSGYGYVTCPRPPSKSGSPFVKGALMTLYEGLELMPSGDTQDQAFEGLVIERNASGNVTRMYVTEGYAGKRTEFLREQAEQGTYWSAKTAERPDTDILFYDLGGLEVFQTDQSDGRQIEYAFGRNHEKIGASQLRDDCLLAEETENIPSIFAFRNGKAVFELAGGELDKISYDPAEKKLKGDFAGPVRRQNGNVEWKDGVRLYHLAPDGSRDSLVDPQTGMAYVTAGGDGNAPLRILVWPVHIGRYDGGKNTAAKNKNVAAGDKTVVAGNKNVVAEDESGLLIRSQGGRILARDKITTSRIASVGNDGYLTGTWRSEKGEESHKLFTLRKNTSNRNMEGQVLLNGNNGFFEKSMRPVYDRHGMPVYYPQSGERYEKETDLWDRSGSRVRTVESDLLREYDRAAYITDGEDSIHEDADPISHRLGEAYLMENTWLTGDIAPDDPFADTVSDGQPDILRRVPVGVYIMEELQAPEGYLRALPAGVIVEETAHIQQASMTDTATKIVIGKTDGTDDYALQARYMQKKGSDGEPLSAGSVIVGKSSYSQSQIPGVRLALYEAERVYSSDLAAHPSGTYLKKKGTEPIEWTTGETPYYLEGIPAGEYLLEELRTPSGYVSPGSMELTVDNTGQVQNYTLYNDHTKVEIEKYRMADGKKEPVEGAGFSLYRALTDERGQVLRDENGDPRYDETEELDHFVSSDGRKYDGFAEAFEELYGIYGTGLQAVSWSHNGKDYTARYLSHEQIDASASHARRLGQNDTEPLRRGEKQVLSHAPRSGQNDASASLLSRIGQSAASVFRQLSDEQGGPSAAGAGPELFPTTAQMRFVTDEGNELRITVYEQKESRRGRTFRCEYQFDYHELPEIQERASSWLTREGMRRLEYLPVGSAFVLAETDPPPGMAKAAPLLLIPEDMGDIQRYQVENEEGRLIISKTIYENGEQGHRELPGAGMALYRADDAGKMILDDAHLAARWVSGEDGVYTELDQINQTIPEGYRPGDRKPHTLNRLPEGRYWLVEKESPEYYTTFRPVLIDYHMEDSIRIIRVSDRPAEGRLEVKKTDEEGGCLTGAVFEVSAYRQPDLKQPVFTKRFSDIGGTAVLAGLPVGEALDDGRIVPYCYRLKEILPPEGYALNPGEISFEFAPDKNGVSYAWGEEALYQTGIRDRKTRIVIRKEELAAMVGHGSTQRPGEAVPVEGAGLAVYEIQGIQENGEYQYDRNSPVEEWVTSAAEPDHVIEGLTAGQTYILAETQVPPGYRRMEPILFTISDDGNRIAGIGNGLAAVTIRDFCKAVIRGRYARKVEMSVTDEKGRPVISWTAAGEGRNLTANDGIRDGQVYTITERTVYSDGAREITGRKTGRIWLREPEKAYLEADRRAERVRLCLKEMNGAELASYYPSAEKPELEIEDHGTDGELFSAGKRYILSETTLYSDGSRREEDRFAFQVGKDGSVCGIAGYDQKTEVVISKKDITGSEELPGAHLQLLEAGSGSQGNGGTSSDEKFSILEEWISGGEPHVIETTLIPGKEYILRETLSPDGYAYASDISFYVSEEGAVESVTMEDAQTRAAVTKTDITGENEVPGARLQILDMDGAVIEEWISDGTPHWIVGKLIAGGTYTLHESLAPSGYGYAENVIFTVSMDGSIDRVTMKDERLPARRQTVSHGPKKGEVGTVTAEYAPFLIGEDGIPLGGLHPCLIPATGDGNENGIRTALMIMAWSGLLCLLLGWLILKRKGDS